MLRRETFRREVLKTFARDLPPEYFTDFFVPSVVGFNGSSKKNPHGREAEDINSALGAVWFDAGN